MGSWLADSLLLCVFGLVAMEAWIARQRTWTTFRVLKEHRETLQALRSDHHINDVKIKALDERSGQAVTLVDDIGKRLDKMGQVDEALDNFIKQANRGFGIIDGRLKAIEELSIHDRTVIIAGEMRQLREQIASLIPLADLVTGLAVRIDTFNDRLEQIEELVNAKWNDYPDILKANAAQAYRDMAEAIEAANGKPESAPVATTY